MLKFLHHQKYEVGLVVTANYGSRKTTGIIKYIIKAGDTPSDYVIRKYFGIEPSHKNYKSFFEKPSYYDRVIISKGNSKYYVVLPLSDKVYIDIL
jgi:hypothetical protein